MCSVILHAAPLQDIFKNPLYTPGVQCAVLYSAIKHAKTEQNMSKNNVHLTLFTIGEIFIIFSIFSDICYFLPQIYEK